MQVMPLQDELQINMSNAVNQKSNSYSCWIRKWRCWLLRTTGT